MGASHTRIKHHPFHLHIDDKMPQLAFRIDYIGINSDSIHAMIHMNLFKI